MEVLLHPPLGTFRIHGVHICRKFDFMAWRKPRQDWINGSAVCVNLNQRWELSIFIGENSKDSTPVGMHLTTFSPRFCRTRYAHDKQFRNSFSKIKVIVTYKLRTKLGYGEYCNLNKSDPWEVLNEQINSMESVGRNQKAVPPTNSIPRANCWQNDGPREWKSYQRENSYHSSEALLTVRQEHTWNFISEEGTVWKINWHTLHVHILLCAYLEISCVSTA